MKRVIVLTVVMCLLLCGCGIVPIGAAENDPPEQKGTTVDSLIDEYRNIPNGGILDVDHSKLSTLGDLMDTTKYRVCGVLTGIEDRAGIVGAYLGAGKEAIHIFLKEGQSPVEGEYVEIVGCILYAHQDDVVLTDCTITDRGSSVRDRLEASK